VCYAGAEDENGSPNKKEWVYCSKKDSLTNDHDNNGCKQRELITSELSCRTLLCYVMYSTYGA